MNADLMGIPEIVALSSAVRESMLKDPSPVFEDALFPAWERLLALGWGGEDRGSLLNLRRAAGDLASVLAVKILSIDRELEKFHPPLPSTAVDHVKPEAIE